MSTPNFVPCFGGPFDGTPVQLPQGSIPWEIRFLIRQRHEAEVVLQEVHNAPVGPGPVVTAIYILATTVTKHYVYVYKGVEWEMPTVAEALTTQNPSTDAENQECSTVAPSNAEIDAALEEVLAEANKGRDLSRMSLAQQVEAQMQRYHEAVAARNIGVNRHESLGGDEGDTTEEGEAN